MSIRVGNGKNGTRHSEPGDEMAAVEATLTPPHIHTPPEPLRPGCPHLGIADDPDTRFLFASPNGTCYRATPAATVNVEHQQAFCLQNQYINCPVWQRAEAGPLPTAIQAESPAEPFWQRRGMWGIVLLLIIIGGASLVIWRFNNGSEAPLPVLAAITDSATTTPAAPTATPLPPLPTNEVAAAAPTAAPPTATAVVTLPPPPAVTPLPSATPPPTATSSPTSSPTTAPLPTASPMPEPTAVPLIAVAVPNLNIRQGPGTNYPIISTAALATEFAITGQSANGSWWQICCLAGEPGWVFGEAITLTGDVSNVPILPAPPVEE